MAQTQYHDLSDEIWAVLEPILPGRKGEWGGQALDNRQFLNGVFWVLRTGRAWRELPAAYGKWGTVHQRFNRWRESGVWEKILEILIDEPDFEWLLTLNQTKTNSPPRYLWPWLRMVCQSETLLQKIPQRITRK